MTPFGGRQLKAQCHQADWRRDLVLISVSNTSGLEQDQQNRKVSRQDFVWPGICKAQQAGDVVILTAVTIKYLDFCFFTSTGAVTETWS